MQAAHPDVGAAVAKFSVYKKDPWGRLFRTGFSMMRFLHGGKRGALGQNEAHDLKKLHAHIKGVHPDGSRYHALTPHTFRVVPDTFLDGAIRYRQAIGKPLNNQQQKQIYQEYIKLCQLFGIDRSELENNIEEFYGYYDKLLLETMTYNETVAYLLGDMMKFGPEIKYLPMPKKWWHAIYRRTLYPLIRTFSIGFIDPRFRAKHHIEWSEDDEHRYQRLLKWVRGFTKVVPRFLRYHPFSLYIMIGGRGTRVMDYQRLQKMSAKIR